MTDAELRALLGKAFLPWHRERTARGTCVFSRDTGMEKRDVELAVAAVNALPGLLDRLDKAKRALEFYGDEDNYHPGFIGDDVATGTTDTEADGGEVARAALAELGGE